jgi:hypothetical protein
MKTFKIVILTRVLLFASLSNAGVINNSDIHIREATDADIVRVPRAKICQGTVPDSVTLSSIHLSIEDLKKGVNCVAADLDGNGYLDFVLYGAWSEKDHRRYCLVIFYKDRSVIRTQFIPEAMEIFSESDPERVHYPKNKGQVGLIRHSDDNSMQIYGQVFFYNKKNGLFEKGAYVYPNGNAEGGDD